MNRILLSGVAVGLLLVEGCGTGQVPSASVSGKVTAGGEAVSGAMICFTDSTTGKAATCDLDGSGAYSITQGLPPGKYKVAVVPKSTMEQAPKVGQAPPKAAASKVAQKYRSDSTSGLEAEIKAGANPNKDFKLD